VDEQPVVAAALLSGGPFVRAAEGEAAAQSNASVPAAFRLDEYHRATVKFVSDAINAVARADGVLSLVTVEQVDSLPISQNTLDNGHVVERPPMEASAAMTFTVAEGIAGDFSEIHLAIADAAAKYSAQLVPQMIEHISQLCDASGNTVNVGGGSIWEAQLKMLETLSLTFDSDGNPTLPTLVMHPDTAARIGQPPPDFQSRYDEILLRRRDEWLAQRRSRRLPRERN
jgi:hypothetical protein